MLDIAEACALIAAQNLDFGTCHVALARSPGHILRQTIHAERALPPYDRVMMDGIAIRHAEGRTQFAVLGAQRAGMPAQALDRADACFEVTTGAVLPEGADTVVPVERIRLQDGMAVLEADYVPARGQFIHARASDCAQGTALLSAGIRLNAPSLAILAGNGYATVAVARAPQIAIVSTGDELVAPDAPVQAWQIRASNDQAIAAALRARGFAELHHAWIADDLDETTATLARLLSGHDVLILSGGVSMGAFDYIPRAMAALGVRQVFHKIAQRPGKPMWFGVGPQGQAVFALPGNPVSALSCCIRYVVPALLQAQGLHAQVIRRVRLAEPVPLIPTLARLMPVRLRQDETGQILAEPHPMPTSGDFNHLAMTDGFVELPKGEEAARGLQVDFHEW